MEQLTYPLAGYDLEGLLGDLMEFNAGLQEMGNPTQLVCTVAADGSAVMGEPGDPPRDLMAELSAGEALFIPFTDILLGATERDDSILECADGDLVIRDEELDPLYPELAGGDLDCFGYVATVESEHLHLRGASSGQNMAFIYVEYPESLGPLDERLEHYADRYVR